MYIYIYTIIKKNINQDNKHICVVNVSGLNWNSHT